MNNLLRRFLTTWTEAVFMVDYKCSKNAFVNDPLRIDKLLVPYNGSAQGNLLLKKKQLPAVV